MSARERAEAEAAQRLRDEGRLLAILGGHVTPRLVASGEDERGPFVVTERLPFPTLAERLERGGALALEVVAAAVPAAFAALAEIHEAADARGPLGIVHADLSPANVAVDDAGARAVILDFGLALFRGAAARDGAFRGTVAYAAPEVARGETPTAASDLFALAATLLHAATATPPRAPPATLAAAIANAGDAPIVLDASRATALGGARAAIAACLAHDPAERPQSAREVLALLP